jgi:alpha-mannosidase
MPHAGDWHEGRVPQAAASYTSPLRAIVATSHKGELPSADSFLSFDNPDFLVTALKKAEHEDAVVVRGYNPTGEAIQVIVTVPKETVSVTQVTLEEKPVGDLKLAKNQVRLSVGRGEIATLLIRRS